MNILYLTSEALPFAKTGGLADVCGTLPTRVADLTLKDGSRPGVAVMMPAYRGIRNVGKPIEVTDISFAVPMAPGRIIGGRLLRSVLPGSEVPVWFVDQPQYFDRNGLYGDGDGDYPDNAERFAFFCRAARIAINRIGMDVDLVHCNDWQSGLFPALIRDERESAVGAAKASRLPATVMTIHNLAYQGHFPVETYPLSGLDWRHFTLERCEFYDGFNFLKTGITTADAVTTVSPRYAAEICTPRHGCALETVLQNVADRTTGIINGIDRNVWDPSRDVHLPVRYGVDDWWPGKGENKLSLQREFGLESSADVPLIGLVGRLASQKGWDLILPVLRDHLRENRPTQWIVLGSGDPNYESQLRQMAAAHPNQLALHIGFNDSLAHRIEAGSDLFVMPSHYEPCGLNQLYSLRYGSVPIVTPTGGLADTVVDTTWQSIEDKTATGFVLGGFTAAALNDAINRALRIRYHQADVWSQIVARGMSQDWSWAKSAVAYARLYEETIALSRRTKPDSTE